MEGENNNNEQQADREEQPQENPEQQKQQREEEQPGPGKSSLGIDENVAALLSYVLGWLTGIIILVGEKKSKFVKFHAMQSLVVFLAIFIITMIPVIGWVLGFILVPLSFVLWILLMYKAYQGERFKLPVVGGFAESQIYEEGQESQKTE